MSFFLTVILESGNNPHLQRALPEHMNNVNDGLVRDFNNDKTKVISFMNEMRGEASRTLIEPKMMPEAHSFIEELANQKNINLKQYIRFKERPGSRPFFPMLFLNMGY